MKKLLTITMTVLMVLGCISLGAFADEGSATVYVTLSDGEGKIALAQEAIEVTDMDEDGALTVNDALYLAHEAKYEGGADAGYSSYMGEFGLALEKLWGEVNGGSYGYYVNNVSAMSLTDPVADGDFLNAFVYTDLEAWSDTYCFFDQYTLSGDGEVSLTLSAAGFDADWNPVTLPVEGAVITVNGEATEVKTDADGKFTVQLDAGTYVISATSDTMTLVPPVCTVTVAGEETETTSESEVPETEVPESAETEPAETDSTETETADTVTEATETDAPATDAPETGSPQTGDMAVVIAFVIAVSVCGAVLSLRKKSYEK